MFLHLIHTDRKFLEPVRQLFESAATGQHVYAFLGTPGCSFEPEDDTPVLRTRNDLRSLLDSRSDWSGAIVNGVAETLGCNIDVVPASIKVAWFPWGHEIYGAHPKLHRNLLGPISRQLDSSRIRRLARPLAWLIQGRLRNLRRAMSRYDYCVCQVKEEFELFQECGLGFRMQHIPAAVSTLESFIDTKRTVGTLGHDIQVGNSASYTNNFPEAFQRLSELDLGSRKVVVPLSYGSERCREDTLKYGERLLGDRFEPILKFMPLTEYCEILSRCGVVVMNHHRQQALANIMGAIWRGAKVYLNRTPVLQGYRRLGFRVGSIPDDLARHNTRVFEPLDMCARAANRELMEDVFGQGSSVKAIQSVLNALVGDQYRFGRNSYARGA